MTQPVRVDPDADKEPQPPVRETENQDQPDPDAPSIAFIPIADIRPNPHQPRQRIDPERLETLAASIKTDGLMQPIIVRPRQQGDMPPYELVAGERRWRAAELAGLDRVPAIVRPMDDQHLAEWALIENLQREDLNPIERAAAFSHLVEQFGLSHDQIAQRVGTDRSTVSNLLRLLHLHDSVQSLIADGVLSGGHGRAVAGLSDPDQQLDLARRAVREGLSVRQVEKLVRRVAEQTSEPGVDKPRAARSAHLSDLEQQISQQLGTKVSIKPARRKGAGTLAIQFYNFDQFDELLERLNVRPD